MPSLMAISYSSTRACRSSSSASSCGIGISLSDGVFHLSRTGAASPSGPIRRSTPSSKECGPFERVLPRQPDLRRANGLRCHRVWEVSLGVVMFAIQKKRRELLRTLIPPPALLAVILTCSTPAAAAGDVKTSHEVRTLKITVLVSNVAGDPHLGDGEWGYSALVEVDGHKILYDTGASSDMVITNAKALNIDLSDVEDVVLSHNHWDHVGGLMTLRREFAKANPRAMSRIYVGGAIFEPRLNEAGEDQNGLRLIKPEYLATGGAFIVHDKPTELYPGVWLTGPVPRPNEEKNWSPGLSLMTAQGRVEDNVPEDSALVFDTNGGIVVLTGCGHAGIVNIVEYARTIAGTKPLLAVIG